MTTKADFDSIDAAIEAFRNGEFLVVVDDEDRENEGDLIIAAEDLTFEKTAFMVRYTSGLICVSMDAERLDRLELPLMVERNTESLRTAYTISVDLAEGTTTGISAADRSKTVQALANPNSKPQDFNRPGHVFPLRAVPGGTLKRIGHTEAAQDLTKLAGKQTVAAICEVVLDDGRMARRDDLKEFAVKWGLKMISIADLVRYRTEKGLGLDW
ncbi:3,4-dihydroxy-2-butanone 4-phosphate synthase [Phlyctochytrium arcticum]|nr:3,4-dihydroxy-2-butanone 4-phosphate synthase [Phlyctochytrium arcticum]